MSGIVEAIYLRPSARMPTRSVVSALAIQSRGLDGDHAGAGRREITLLSRESWDATCAELGRSLDPAIRRANILVRGLPLGDLIGQCLTIGPVRIEVVGETRPCELMDDLGGVGLCAALRADRRGGIHGRILTGGTIAVGDVVNFDLATAP
ncbi:MAG: MOSC domain-containing protein [Planctomycetota bacterium]